MRVAIIPARGGSKRIKRKNIKLFNSKPIIYWTIKELKKSKLFDLIIVSSDDDKILSLCKKYKVDITIKRPQYLSNHRATTKSVIVHAIEYLLQNNIKAKILGCFYPCNPFLMTSDISKSLRLLKKNKKAFIFSASKYSHPIQRAFLINNFKVTYLNKNNRNKNTQKFTNTYYDCAHFYIGSAKVWKNDYTKNINLAVKIPYWRSVDIDNNEDWKKAELFYKILNIK
jgi:pseudaminic acid cytidylyltransferase